MPERGRGPSMTQHRQVTPKGLSARGGGRKRGAAPFSAASMAWSRPCFWGVVALSLAISDALMHGAGPMLGLAASGSASISSRRSGFSGSRGRSSAGLALPLSAPSRRSLIPARHVGGSAVMQTSSGIFGAETVEIYKGDRAIIVGVDIKRNLYKTRVGGWQLQDSLDELERLCKTAGIEVVQRDIQNMQNPSSSTFIGSGKVDEIALAIQKGDVQAVVFDDELSPGQQRNLQKAFGETIKVIDRTQLILQIFSQRARTKEAKLQVQAAQLKYMLPRLQYFMTQGAGMDAKGGGRGLKGMGETQVEMDRRLFRGQIQRIEKEIEAVKEQRELYRAKRRERDNLPLVAIVGYTNAGKSTLLNKLVGTEEVYADDMLFATLDPTSRRIQLPGGKESILTDTVGFIQKLPTRLVASFRATLEELEDATLILHVVDSSSPVVRQQVYSVQAIIEELMVEDTPQIMVLNKCDKTVEIEANKAAYKLLTSGGRDKSKASDTEKEEVSQDVSGDAAEEVDDEEEEDTDGYFGADGADMADDAGDDLFESLSKVHKRVVPELVLKTSSLTGEGLQDLLLSVEQALLSLNAMVSCLVPYSKGDLLNEIHKVGTIVEEEFIADGTRVVAYVPPSLRGRLKDYITEG